MGSYAEFGSPEYGDPRASCTIVVQADGTMRYSSILNILQFDKGSLLTNPALSASIEIAHDRNSHCFADYRARHFTNTLN
jgi:hypothetical protein